MPKAKIGMLLRFLELLDSKQALSKELKLAFQRHCLIGQALNSINLFHFLFWFALHC